MEERFSFLIELYADGAATDEQKEELMALIRSGELDDMLETFADRAWEITPVKRWLTKDQSQKIFQNILHPAPVIKMDVPDRKPKRIRWFAAASIILILLAGAFWYVNRPGTKTISNKPIIAKEIKAPDANHAIITFSDGRQLAIDNSDTGTLATEGSVRIRKNANGEIEYLTNTGRQGTPVFNTLFNPRGSQIFPLVLNDGTKVWLNNETIIKYPSVFNGTSRQVELTGEAYFEVAHDAARPFHVLVNGIDVQVLGTHFNINRYSGERQAKITLLRGSVKVTPASGSQNANFKILEPGQQASVDQSGVTIRNDVDLEEVMAWKNGLFLLDNTSLPSIMKQISRWYDVDIQYAGVIPDRRFEGGISKKLPLSEVLQLLNANGIHSRLEGKKLVVQP